MNKTKRFARKTIFIAMLAATGLAYADAPEIEQLKQYAEQGQSEMAYQIAKQYGYRYDGDAEFDLYHGIAAIDTGHANEGVAVLKKLVSTQPQNHRARLELARGETAVGDRAAARENFEKVLSINPPDSVKQHIQGYLINLDDTKPAGQKTTDQKSYQGYASATVGHDSNVNGGPNNAEFYSPLLGVGSLAPGAVKTSDNYSEVSAGAQATKKINKNVGVFAAADATTKTNVTHSSLNTTTYDVTTGIACANDQATYRTSLIHQGFSIAGNTNRNIYGVTTEAELRQQDNLSVTPQASYVATKYPTNSLMNSKTVSAGLSAKKGLLDNKLVAYGAASVGHEVSDDRSTAAKAAADHNFIGGQIGANYLFSNRVLFRSSLETQKSAYNGENLLFLTNRSDMTYGLNAGVTLLVTPKWQATADYNYTKNNSNFPVNEYDKYTLNAGMRYNF